MRVLGVWTVLFGAGLAAAVLAVGAAARSGTSAQPVRATVRVRRALAAAYARKHHVKRPTVGKTRVARTGNTFYAVAMVKRASGQPEMFSGKRRSAKATVRWRDLRASHGKPCSFPQAVVSALGYAKACGSGGTTTGATTTGTTTTTADPGSPYDIALTWASPAFAEGSTCLVNYTIKNVGTATFPATITKLTLTPTAGGTTHAVYDQVIPLQVGEVYTQQMTFSFDCSSGSYTETVDADSDPASTAVQESDYANNVSTQTVTPSDLKLPDLTVTSVTLGGDCETVAIVIKNIGNADAGASTARISASADRSEIANDFVPTDALAPGQSEAVNGMLDTPTCHNLTIMGQADFDQVVAESNEGNNFLQVTIP